jgi:hypothetical protein
MYFEGIKVGNWVWNIGKGQVRVEKVYKDYFTVRSGVYWQEVTMEGLGMGDTHQSVFWSKPEFVPPARPKTKVEKVIEGPVCRSDLHLIVDLVSVCVRRKENEETVNIKLSYEVEE